MKTKSYKSYSRLKGIVQPNLNASEFTNGVITDMHAVVSQVEVHENRMSKTCDAVLVIHNSSQFILARITDTSVNGVFSSLKQGFSTRSNKSTYTMQLVMMHHQS